MKTWCWHDAPFMTIEPVMNGAPVCPRAQKRAIKKGAQDTV